MFRHQGGDLLPHRLAQDVRLAPGEARDFAHHLQDLVLVHADAVRLLEDRLEDRVQVAHRHLAVLGAGEGGDVVHRAGPIEGHDGDQVADLVRLQAAKAAAHAVTFQLEDGRRLALPKHLEGLARLRVRVVGGDDVQIEIDPLRLFENAQGAVDDGEVGEAQEVHLEHAGLFDGAHRPLGDEGVIALGAALQGNVFHKRVAGDDNAGGVRGRVAGDAFETGGEVKDLRDARVAFGDFLQVGCFAGLGDGGAKGDGARDGVDLGEAQAHDAGDVAYRGAGGHRAEGNDLGDPVAAVLLLDVADDLLAAVVGKVHVDIRHADALLVQEALEHQAVGQRVDVADAQGVDDERTGDGTTGHGENAVFAGKADVVGDDEEVEGVAGAVDDVEFVLEARTLLLVDAAVALGDARKTLLPEEGRRRVAVGQVEAREVDAGEVEVQLDLLGDDQGVREDFGHAREGPSHFGPGPQVELLCAQTHAVGLVDRRPGLDAQEDVVRAGIRLRDVMGVVGRDDAHTDLARDGEEVTVQLGLAFETLILDLDEVVIAPEQVGVPPSDSARGVGLAVENQARQLTRHAPGEGGEAPGVAFQEGLVDARTVVEAVDAGRRDEAQEVAVALLVAREEGEVEGFVVEFGLTVGEGPRGDVDLAADDRLDARLSRGRIELDDAVQVAVVGEGDGGLAHRLCPPDDPVDPPEAVEEGILGVDVQVNEVRAVGVGRCDGFGGGAWTSCHGCMKLRGASGRGRFGRSSHAAGGRGGGTTVLVWGLGRRPAMGVSPISWRHERDRA